MIRTLAVLLSLVASPVLSGERIENDGYALPDIETPSVHVICQDLDSLYVLLDNLQESIDKYFTDGSAPTNCAVFHPAPLPLGGHSLDHLYLTDETNLFGVVRVPFEAGEAWTYINENTMVKGNEGTF